MTSRNLQIENMHCGACVRRVTLTLSKVPGTSVEDVQIGSARVTTDADPGLLLEALMKSGYPARLGSA